jgi:proteasome lid subunit RPN8/RPN11
VVKLSEEGFHCVLKLVTEELEDGVILPKSASYEEVVPFLFDRVRGEPVEVFGALFFDHRGATLGYTMPYRGTTDRVGPEHRHLLIKAWSCRARAMIVFHNHPGGTTTPSEGDIGWTLGLLALAAPLDVLVLDHVILGREPEYGSMRSCRRVWGLGWNSNQWWSTDRVLKAHEERRRHGRSSTRRPARVKYRDPDTGETWSGRGSMAKWLARHVEAGRDPEEFAVDPKQEERRRMRLD